jgi:hypothetical protein
MNCWQNVDQNSMQTATYYRAAGSVHTGRPISPANEPKHKSRFWSIDETIVNAQ